MNIGELKGIFKEKFGTDSSRVFFAPGRINLIGEHTDYNGGHVFPCAITFGTYALVRKRTDQRIRMYSVNIPTGNVIEFNLSDLQYNPKHDWANYPKGMVYYYTKIGYRIDSGFDVLFYGNIPNGAGLSSSASIEMVTGVMLEKLYDLKINRMEMVKIAQKVENEYIGVNSGIMDQFTVGMGKENHAILLDCDTLKYQYIPVYLNKYRIVIMNTNKRRELADSKYNERRKECEAALKELQQHIKIKHLGNLTTEQFDQLQHHITHETNRRRAKHVVYENERTLAAAKILQTGNLELFGKLLNASHQSLRYDYEVTGKELDTIVEAAWQQDGVLGARMTGAGFGGCAIALVKEDQVPVFIEQVGKIYESEIGYKANFYHVTIGDGAKEITETTTSSNSYS